MIRIRLRRPYKWQAVGIALDADNKITHRTISDRYRDHSAAWEQALIFEAQGFTAVYVWRVPWRKR